MSMGATDPAQIGVTPREAAPLPSVGWLRKGFGLAGVLPACTLIAGVVVWQLLVSLLDVPDYILPEPTAVWQAGIEYHSDLLKNGWTTLMETVVGFALSAAVGIPLAVVMNAWPPISRALYPLLVSSQVIPKIAVAPLFVVWIGTGWLTSAILAFVMAFFPVVVNTVLGLESVDKQSLQLIRSMGGSRWDQFRYLRLPNAMPHIWTGLKLAMAFAVVGAIVGEFVGSQSGLGYLLLVAQGNLLTALLFADLIVLTVGGLLLYYLVDFAGRKAVRWT
jgi:NitT/TauT family transport system permease protein